MPPGTTPVGVNDLLTAAKNLVVAVNGLQGVIKALSGTGSVTLPQGAMSGSVGAFSGQYLLITAPDGNPYKIPLYLPA